MHGCASGSLLLVNAGVDSMGGVIDGGVEISSAPSSHQSSDLEKTQAELRETFSAAEKFRKELDFLQKGGDPLDLKVGTAASVSLQSTSLTDQHPEQFVTSEVKGSFAITASPHGDSVESSGRLGALSVGEPNSADNLMLFDGDNKFREVERRLNKESGESVPLELPKKSYKRRIRSRPNRHAGRDTKGSLHNAENQDHKYLSNSISNPKSPKNLGSNSRLDIKSNGTQTQISNQETPLSISSLEPVGHVEQETLSGSENPLGVDTHMVGDLALSGQTKGFDSKSSCSHSGQSLDGNNKNEVPASIRNVDSNGIMEVNLASKEGNDVNTVKDDKILSINNDDNEIGSTLKEEEGLKDSETSLQHELKKSGVDLDGCTTSDIETKHVGSEQKVCSENNQKLATKEHEDSILEEARIIEEKRKRIAGLSVGVLKSENHHKSHWHFLLEEMSWLANDFAQERLWKVTAAAQISKRAAYNSHVRFQKQTCLWKQKEVAHTLAKSVMEFWHTVQVKGLELEGSKKDSMVGLHKYGMRFLEYNSSNAQYSSAQAPVTPDRISDLGITHISWEDNLTEENLFYVVPPGAIEAYRKAIESYLLQSERTGSSMQDEVDANGYDDMADNTLEEDEGETSTYYLPGAFEGSRLSKTTQKKRKHGPHFRSYGARSYETGADLSFPQSLERNIGTQPSVLSGKRPASSINISIPTKRVRTASRPRFTGTSGYNNNNNQAPNRTDASSGDTNSFQDEQSSLHGGYQLPNNMEAESVGDYEKQLHFDMTEVSNRPKKKKKGSTFDHRWQLDSSFQNDQKEHSKRRLDSRQFDSNGNSVASQTSNMSNPNKFMKLLVRDRGRKAKSLKTPVGPQGSGSPWSLFEDQALVVLVHDMGANWELISDAINSTLQFKCISRNSKECKERHKILMDRSTGDGADSAEDSGSSQPYPSTLPGIPEGSARQLFQRLQGPMEEDTLKSHFEKIIVISRKLHHRKSQKDNQDPKQLQQPHGSHALALSQVCPNNLNGGPVLTPLDLCEPISSSPDFLPAGYQVPHTGAPIVPGSSPSSSLPGSSNLVYGTHTHLAAPSSPISPSVREGRYAIPRTGSLPMDDPHRMQHYNQMLSARNMQPSSLSPGPHSDRGVRMLPGGNSMGVMSGMNRGMMMARPINNNNPPSMMNSREPVHMIRNPDHQQVAQGGTTQGIPAYATGMGSFPNQNPQPPVQPYPMSPHMPNHLPGPPTNAQHPAFGMRLMKERQLQQQRLRQQQFAASNPMSPRVQPQQTQFPVTSPQSNAQIQPQSHSSPVTQRNPQTGGNAVKPQRRPPQQLQPPGGRQLGAKVMKGGGKGTPGDPSVPNGFVAQKGEMHHLLQSGGPSGLNPLIQKRFPGQPQQKSKLVNQSQLTVAQKMALQNRKANPSDLSTTSSKLQARGAPLTQTSCDDVAPVSLDPNRKTFDDSSGKVETGMSPPESTTAEHSGPPPVSSTGVQCQNQPSS
ncbi:hypothetical protein L2E82_00395 [Cichorium intybus]|uniref:Uncharacterized protein n=1 Tax=Cichorium intybus TaxID=13427 RepID=A0ACB9GWQ7_CICIN|nr:hypothetical protein L2E82_00395 [Cichorium intybus]